MSPLRPAFERSAAVEHREPVTDRERVADIMGDEDDAQSARSDFADAFEHHCGLRDAKGRRRLVEDQDLRAEINRPGDGNALPLAARQSSDGLLGIAQFDPHFLHFCRGHFRRPCRCRTAGRVPSGGSVRGRGRNCAQRT